MVSQRLRIRSLMFSPRKLIRNPLTKKYKTRILNSRKINSRRTINVQNRRINASDEM